MSLRSQYRCIISSTQISISFWIASVCSIDCLGLFWHSLQNNLWCGDFSEWILIFSKRNNLLVLNKRAWVLFHEVKFHSCTCISCCLNIFNIRVRINLSPSMIVVSRYNCHFTQWVIRKFMERTTWIDLLNLKFLLLSLNLYTLQHWSILKWELFRNICSIQSALFKLILWLITI